MRRKNKSYYYKFLTSFAIIISIFIVMVLFIFSLSQNLIREQILLSSQNTLYQFYQRVDEVLGEAKEICVTVLNNSDNQFNSKQIIDTSQKKAYYVWKISEQLKFYTGKKYFDIFEYYPNEDYVVSAANASAGTELFCDVFYGDKNGETEKEFRKIANSTSGKPVLLRMKKEDGSSYLCVAMRQTSYKNEKYDYVIVVVLNPDYVSGLLDKVEGERYNSLSLITNEQEEFLYSTDDFVFYNNFVEQDYFIQKQQSKVMDLQYIHAVPRGYFWSKLVSLYVVCCTGILTMLALGILLALKQSRRVYQPVKDIIEELQRYTSISYDHQENTEFEFIESLFQKEKSEKIALNKNINKSKEYKRKNFVWALLNGSSEFTEKIEMVFEENGVVLCYDCFCVVLLRVEDYYEMSNELTTFVLTNVFEELCNQEGRGYVTSLSDKKYAVLINMGRGMDEHRILEKISGGKAFLQQHYNLNMTISLSTVKEDISGIHEAYKEAEAAMEYRYLLGKESVICYRDITTREFTSLKPPKSAMYHMVVDALDCSAEKEDMVQLVDDILETNGIDEEKSIETVRCFEFETVSMLYGVLLKEGLWDLAWKEQITNLLRQETLEGFKEYLAEMLLKLHKEKTSREENEDICDRVKKHIEEHFGDEQLSRTQLGEIFGVAPGYLSKIFKEKYKLTIPEFIAGVRVENAKWQLDHTDYPVQEIAKRNGFVNSASFIRTFKRQEGVAPGTYRERNR